MNIALLALLASSPARAWYHLQYEWDPSEVPIQWYMGVTVDDSIDMEIAEVEVQAGFDNWEVGAPCAELGGAYKGYRTDDFAGGFVEDGKITMAFEDPKDDLDEGVLAATYCNRTSEYAASREGKTYYYVHDCDIVYNDFVVWESREDITSGLCAGGTSLEAVSTHEIGHLWGLGHSCDDPSDTADANKPLGEACDTPEELDATMFWQGGSCDLEQATMTSDDLESINRLYGPSCSFEMHEETPDGEESDHLAGGAPYDVCFTVECSDFVDTEAVRVNWNFGDGTTSSELEPCHTYETKGQFTVILDVEGGAEDDGVCGVWDHNTRARSGVLVCGVPEPGLGFEGLFTYEYEVGNTYQMINQTDTSVYGCVDQVRWDVYDGDEVVQSLNAWSPRIDFKEAGSYRVVLNVSGPGGASAAELTIDVENKSGFFGGCSSAAGAASGLAGLLAGLASLARRRR